MTADSQESWQQKEKGVIPIDIAWDELAKLSE